MTKPTKRPFPVFSGMALGYLTDEEVEWLLERGVFQNNFYRLEKTGERCYQLWKHGIKADEERLDKPEEMLAEAERWQSLVQEYHLTLSHWWRWFETFRNNEPDSHDRMR